MVALRGRESNKPTPMGGACELSEGETRPLFQDSANQNSHRIVTPSTNSVVFCLFWESRLGVWTEKLTKDILPGTDLLFLLGFTFLHLSHHTDINTAISKPRSKQDHELISRSRVDIDITAIMEQQNSQEPRNEGPHDPSVLLDANFSFNGLPVHSFNPINAGLLRHLPSPLWFDRPPIRYTSGDPSTLSYQDIVAGRPYARRHPPKEQEPSMDQIAMDENKASVLQRLAVLEAEASGKAPSSSSSAPSLQKEWKAMMKKKGKGRTQKPCFGAGRCSNALCDHAVVVPFAPAPEEQKMKEKLLSVMREKSAKDGYAISEEYGRAFLERCGGKIVLALEAVKADINSREAALINTGRINWEKEQVMAAARPKGPAENGRTDTRDERLSFLEHDDFHLNEMVEEGWRSMYGRLIKKRYPAKKQAVKAFKANRKAAMMRAQRAEYYTDVRKEDITQEELNCLMEKWDEDNHNVEYINAFADESRTVGEPRVPNDDDDDDEEYNAEQPAEEGEENYLNPEEEEDIDPLQVEEEHAADDEITVFGEENVPPEVEQTPEEVNTNEAPEEAIRQVQDYLLMLDSPSRQFLGRVVDLQISIGGGSLEDIVHIPEDAILQFIAATDILDRTTSAYILGMCGNNFDRAMAFYPALHRELILHLYRQGVVIIQHNNLHQELSRFVEMFWLCMTSVMGRR
ncbi:uncharacterized protein BP5553_05164 [Venustampulla echinocandica]|uniref:Uncharacterized protein n=1 Tax=Venustampulla echinocandica TaxID=2656787 RepID=A0A370TQC6_9HELO|nr:uncharacterized protein BP5553_05164 [Venustampulla echinocandica]RDL37731.1 hypothetical protein BP5553_05164 [Venustampulla echinocandica]